MVSIPQPPTSSLVSGETGLHASSTRFDFVAHRVVRSLVRSDVAVSRWRDSALSSNEGLLELGASGTEVRCVFGDDALGRVVVALVVRCSDL